MIAGEWLHDQPRAVVVERLEHVSGGAHGIAHVVQAVEGRDEVVAGARVLLRGGGAEPHAVAQAGLVRACGRLVERALVAVEAGELGRRERLGHHQRGGAVAAADVGHARARQQLGLDAVERGDPRRHEVRAVGGPGEARGSVEQRVVVLVPAGADPAAERVGDPRLVAHGRRHQLEGAGEERRAGLVGEHDGVLGGQRVQAVLVGHVRAGGLRAQPLAHAALAGAGPLGQFARGERTRSRHRLVEPEPVADHDQRSVERGAELSDGPVDELLDLLRIDLHFDLGRHAFSLGIPPWGRDGRRLQEGSHQEGTWAFAGSAPIASASSGRELMPSLR